MSDLISRLEAAEGPSRELDYAIFTEIAPLNSKSTWSPEEGHFYTSSIDTALTLVPEGCRVELAICIASLKCARGGE